MQESSCGARRPAHGTVFMQMGKRADDRTETLTDNVGEKEQISERIDHDSDYPEQGSDGSRVSDDVAP